MLHRLLARVATDPGRAFLTALGVAWIGLGVTWLLLPSRSRELGIDWSPLLAQWIVGLLWITAGVIGFAAAAVPAWRRVGFAAIQAAPFFLAGVFGVSTVIALIPDHVVPGGRIPSISTAVSYLAFWAAAVIAAQVPTPEQTQEGTA